MFLLVAAAVDISFTSHNLSLATTEIKWFKSKREAGLLGWSEITRFVEWQ